MASSDTEIANLSLSHLGTGKVIANLTTEQSQEAKVCRTFFDFARKATLRDMNWPFARQIVTLGLIESDPNTEWAYSYAYPSNCAKAIRILSGIRNDSRQSRVPYKLSRGDSGTVIFTDKANAELEYTVDEKDTGRFTPDFDLSLSYRLAMYTSPRLTKGDPFKIKLDMENRYLNELRIAQANAFNEQQDEEEKEAEMIRARN